jgi:D-alanyl-D-alanine carboxypeptidase/D-alanyl-D-alanine-endopeptidase (penicillin-binding protein 4)
MLIKRKFDLSTFLLFTFYFLILTSCSITKQIAKSAKNNVINDSSLVNAHLGISIYEPATGKYWYNYNGEKYFVPASNTKIPTCYAAMKYLGDSLVAARVSVNDKGALLLFPSGDPTFLNPEFKYQPLLNKIKQFNQVFLYDDNWKDERWGNGWSWNDYDGDYMAERSLLPIFGNVIKFDLSNDTLKIVPNKISIEAAASLGYDRTTSIIKSKNFSIDRKLDENDFFLRPSGRRFSNTSIPLRTDLGAITEILKETIKVEVVPASIAPGYSFNPPKEIVHSQPTDSLLKPMMHRSDNFFAEQTLLMVSNELLGVMNDARIIDTLLKTDFKDLPQKPRWADGSGLSRYNLFTPQDFVAILNKMKNEFGMERIKVILATGGEGTISSYYKTESGFIFGKTGTLSGVVAFSGFLYTKKGKLLIFSTLVNNHNNSSSTGVRRAVEKFIQHLRNNY